MNEKKDNIMAKKILDDGVIKFYQEYRLSTYKIGKMYGTSAQAVYEYLKNRGINFRCKNDKSYKKYHLNENYFEHINTEDKAYFLGLFFAEGNISREKSMAIGMCDKSIIEELRNRICIDIPIVKISPNDKNKQTKDFYQFHFVNKKIHLDLYNWGIRPNKSNLQFHIPKLQKELYPHFIRGFFDGDGTIHETRNRRSNQHGMKFGLCGNKLFLHDIRQILPIKTNNLYKYGKIYLLIISKFEYLEILYDWLYNNSTIYLDRKYYKWSQLRMQPNIKSDLRKARNKGGDINGRR